MLRNSPRLKYCGLTIILSNPSRFDKLNLLTATGGVFFNKECLYPDYNIMQCDIRLAEDTSPFLPDTKCLLLCGEYAMHRYIPDTQKNTLNEMRGSPLYHNTVNKTIPAMATFFIQEAADYKNYERMLNEESKDYIGGEDSDRAETDEDETNIKSHSATRRSNYAFWVKSDIKKCTRLLKEGFSKWPEESKPNYRIYPSADEVINTLQNPTDEYMCFDIETDIEDQNLQCFSYTFDGRTIYSVPILDYNYKPAYSNWHHIIRALAISFKKCCVVAHNGAEFDFLIFGYKYRIPIFRVFDTRIAMHRCFPEVETSLGHCISYWIMQRFHKDMDSQAYVTMDHMMSRLRYCGLDTFTLYLVFKAIINYARSIPGLVDSIDCANRSIRPYLGITLQGIPYDERKVKEIIKENDRLMMLYVKIIETLIGPQGMLSCRGSVKKAGLIPSSNPQCCNYFYEQLGYKVVGKLSEKTNKPSLGKGNLFQLALEHDNPVIFFINLYRQIQKETGALQFNPWKDDNGKIFPRRKELIDEC